MIKSKKGFSLTELLISLLVISMVLAAAIPAITRRASLQHENIWHWTNSNNVAYSAVGENQSVIVGSDSTPTTYPVGYSNIYGKLFIDNNNRYPIIFSKAKEYIGHLLMDKDRNVGLGYLSLSNLDTKVGTKTYENRGNIAIGTLALENMQDGSYNNVIGYEAMKKNSLGISNIAIGNNACQNITQGSFNLCLGAGSGPASDTVISNKVYIGSLIEGSTADNSKYVQFKLYNGAATMSFTGDSSGNVAISPTSGKFLYLQNAEILETSDIRKKNILGDNKSGLDKINKLEVKNYTFKDDKTKTPHVGVIAQQLKKIFPDAVTTDSDGYLKIRKEDIFYAMVNSIKELSQKLQDMTAKITGLDKRLSELESQNKLLKEQNAEFEKRLEKLEKSSAKTK